MLRSKTIFKILVSLFVPFVLIACASTGGSKLKSADTETEFPYEKSELKKYKEFWDGKAWKTKYKKNLSIEEKIAGLAKFWSEVKYNFAYFDQVPKLDWDKEFQVYLKKVMRTKSTYEYYKLLIEMGAKLDDGHTWVKAPKELNGMYGAEPAIKLTYLNGKTYVRKVYDKKMQKLIKPGYEVIRVNKIPLKKYADRYVRPYVSQSAKHMRDYRVYAGALLQGQKRKSVSVTFKNPEGKVFSRALKRIYPRAGAKEWNDRKDYEFKMVGDTAVVSFTTFGEMKTADKFVKDFDKISKAKKIIIDLRRNPGGSSGVGYKILSYLVDKKIESSVWQTRIYRPSYRAWKMWGSVEEPIWNWHKSQHTETASHKTPFLGPVALLIGMGTGSAAEDFAVSFSHMKRGPIVGSPTAGTTGQPLPISLPGGGEAWICTKKDTFPDGTEFVGYGVKPTVSVEPTYTQYFADKDVVMEKAMALLKR